MQKLRDRVRELTPRSGGVSLRAVIEALNPVLRGWYGYFKHAHAPTFRVVDGFVRRRLPSILRKHQGQPREAAVPTRTIGAGRTPSLPSKNCSP